MEHVKSQWYVYIYSRVHNSGSTAEHLTFLELPFLSQGVL
jgi:hypothetical protein